MNTSCAIIGSGHNGLVAACYLAQAGISVTIFEKNSVYGGAAVSAQAFEGLEARLSRYSYLVALLPDELISELDLDIALISRSISSFTPQGEKGLMIERSPSELTRESFINLTGSDQDFNNWLSFYKRLENIAQKIAPTLLQPLMSERDFKALIDQVDQAAWNDFFVQPIGKTIENYFESDLVRGIVLTDALIGTFTDGFDTENLANRCFLYHLIGNGSGEWKVPKGGMGAVTTALYQRAISLGVTINLNCEVISAKLDSQKIEITDQNQLTYAFDYLVGNLAPSKFADLTDALPRSTQPDGSQVKINLLLEKLPRLKSGHDPKQAFAGTFHINESVEQIRSAYQQVLKGEIPNLLPAEIYCHTLTDNSILGKDLAQAGYHTITLFGLLMKASLFDTDLSAKREIVKNKYLTQLNEFLIDDIYECIAKDSQGNLCIEVKLPQDLEVSVGLPRGHIFHEDLKWPYAQNESEINSWGCETFHPRFFLCSSAARRGGGVSGITGHNAAKALLQSVQHLGSR